MELTLGGGNGAAPQAGALIKDSSTATFMQDVIDASMQVPVIVDFWAPWCGPCKQLGPILEKVVTGAKGAVRMVKVNIDENPEIAQQLRIQSIPTVYAFSQGRPIDAFQGALPESQVRAFVDKLVKEAGTQQSSPIDEALEQAQALMAAEDYATAQAIYSQILQHENDNIPATAGLARCMTASGDFDQARQILAAVPENRKLDAEVTAALSALELAEQAASVGDLGELQAKVEAAPADPAARYDYALALYAKGKAAEAIDQLIEIVRRNKAWNDQAARKELVKIFEARGGADPVTVEGRRKLSAVLFA